MTPRQQQKECLYKPMCYIVHHRRRVDKNRKKPRESCVSEDGYKCQFDTRFHGMKFPHISDDTIYLPLSKSTWDLFSRYDIEKTPEQIIVELLKAGASS